jgi:hypothetical protein
MSLEEMNTSTFKIRVLHFTGFETRPEGIIAVVFGAIALCWWTQLRRGQKWSGYVALGVGLASLILCVVEILRLQLGDRNGFDQLTSLSFTPTARAIGLGLWLAGAASLALVVNAWEYLWLAYGQWHDELRNPNASTAER